MAKTQLGIYFGSRQLGMVETRGPNVINQVTLPLSDEHGGAFSLSSNLATEEVKIAAFIQEMRRKLRIEATDVVVSVSLSSFMIRLFEMQNIPRHELQSAVSFEVKKYIPFKLDDLFFDFHYRVQKKDRRKIDVIFSAIRKETVDTIFSIFSQCGLRVTAIEPVNFSALRALRYSKSVDENGAYGFINVEEDEISFTIMDSSFVAFSHEIKTEGAPEEIFPRLVNEVRISLDFYARHSSNKEIEKIVLFSENAFLDKIENLNNEIGTRTIGLDFKNKNISKNLANTALFGAYGASLYNISDFPLKINIFKSRAIAKELSTRLSGAKLLKSIFIGLVIVLLAYLWGLHYKMNSRSEFEKLKKNIQSSARDAGVRFSSISDLEAERTKDKIKVDSIKARIDRRSYLTPKLSKLVNYLPDGIWLTALSIQEESGKLAVIMSGSAYSDDAEKNIAVIDEFLNKLNSDAEFSKKINKLVLLSVSKDKNSPEGRVVTSFRFSSQK